MKNKEENVLRTDALEYTDRLVNKRNFGLKKYIRKHVDLQFPYRWNLKSLKPGLTLEIGCGIGRNLETLQDSGVGIDHNVHSIKFAKENGLIAFIPEEFQNSIFNKPHTFDSLLLSHIAEHMNLEEFIQLIQKYLNLLKPDGKIIVITPQEVGYKSDASHIEFMNFIKLRQVALQINSRVIKEYSFPFPRFFGYLFIYNEFVSVSKLIN